MAYSSVFVRGEGGGRHPTSRLVTDTEHRGLRRAAGTGSRASGVVGSPALCPSRRDVVGQLCVGDGDITVPERHSHRPPSTQPTLCTPATVYSLDMSSSLRSASWQQPGSRKEGNRPVFSPCRLCTLHRRGRPPPSPPDSPLNPHHSPCRPIPPMTALPNDQGILHGAARPCHSRRRPCCTLAAR